MYLLCVCIKLALWLMQKVWKSVWKRYKPNAFWMLLLLREWMWWRSHVSSKLYGFVRYLYVPMLFRSFKTIRCIGCSWWCNNAMLKMKPFELCQMSIQHFGISCKLCDARDVRWSILLFIMIQLCGWFAVVFFSSLYQDQYYQLKSSENVAHSLIVCSNRMMIEAQ